LTNVLFNGRDHKADRIALTAIAVVMALFSLPLLANLTFITHEIDWLQLWSLRFIERQAIVANHQLPLHTHLAGGGFPYNGHPENMAYSPLFVLILAFGEVVGQKLVFVFTFVAGAAGMFYLCLSALGLTLAGSLVAALMFGLNSYMPYHIHTGNMGVTNYYFTPWALAFLLQGRRERRYLLWAAALMVFLLTNAIGLPFANMWLFLVVVAVLHSVGREGGRFRFAGAPLRCLVLVLLFTVGLGAFRILPIAEGLGLNERRFTRYADAAVGSVSPHNLYLSLCSHGPYKKPDRDFLPDGGTANSVMYVGHLMLFMGVAAFVLRWKETWRYLVALVFFALMCMGKHSPLDLFYVFWHLPVFRSIHLPSKYFSFFVVCTLAIAVAHLFSAFASERRRPLGLIVLLIALVGLGDMFIANRRYLTDLFDVPPPQAKPEPSFYQMATFRMATGLDGRRVLTVWRYEPQQYFWMKRNIGKINWYSGNEIAEHAVPKFIVDAATEAQLPNPAYKGEAHFLSPKNHVRSIRFAANSVWADVEVAEPDLLTVNQNSDPAWRANEGVVERSFPLLTVRLTHPGVYQVRLRYRPLSFYLGGGISLAALVAAVLWLRRGRDGVME